MASSTPSHIVEHIGVGRSNHVEAERFQHLCSILVVCEFCRKGMCGAIDLHNEFALESDEIDDEAVDRMLAPEFPSQEPAASELLP